MGTEHTVAKVAFGLGFNVVRDATKKSGYAPAHVDGAVGRQLFADLRLEGFAALLKLDLITTLVIVGGVEKASKTEPNPPHEADAIRKMLVLDFGISDERVVTISSGRNTAGNAGVIARYIEENELAVADCVSL